MEAGGHTKRPKRSKAEAGNKGKSKRKEKEKPKIQKKPDKNKPEKNVPSSKSFVVQAGAETTNEKKSAVNVPKGRSSSKATNQKEELGERQNTSKEQQMGAGDQKSNYFAKKQVLHNKISRLFVDRKSDLTGRHSAYFLPPICEKKREESLLTSIICDPFTLMEDSMPLTHRPPTRQEISQRNKSVHWGFADLPKRSTRRLSCNVTLRNRERLGSVMLDAFVPRHSKGSVKRERDPRSSVTSNRSRDRGRCAGGFERDSKNPSSEVLLKSVRVMSKCSRCHHTKTQVPRTKLVYSFPRHRQIKEPQLRRITSHFILTMDQSTNVVAVPIKESSPRTGFSNSRFHPRRRRRSLHRRKRRTLLAS